MFIGLDFYYFFVIRDIVRGGFSELVVVYIILGWVFCGLIGGYG